MTNLVESFKKKMMENRYVAVITIIFFIVISFSAFLLASETIYSFLAGTHDENDIIIEYPTMQPNEEILTIYTSRIHSDYDIEIIQLNLTYLPAILPVYFDCILTNNGEETISILDYELIQINTDYPISDYSYMNEGLFESTGEKLQFPLNIDSKKSYKFYIKVGIAIHPDAYALISNNFTPLTRISINEINSYLAMNGMDLYGNSVDPIIRQGEYLGAEGPNLENLQEQIFLITFKTGRGNYFNDSLYWYKLKQF